MSRKTQRKPLTSPTLRCPFTGEPVSLVEVRRGPHEGEIGWIARGPFWFTKVFDTREEALWFLAHRDGVPPAFPPGPSIKVQDREVPPPPEEKEHDPNLARDFLDDQLR
jgi:hypothetical protein